MRASSWDFAVLWVSVKAFMFIFFVLNVVFDVDIAVLYVFAFYLT